MSEVGEMAFVRSLLASVAHPIALTGADGRFIVWSSAFGVLAGTSAEPSSVHLRDVLSAAAFQKFERAASGESFTLSFEPGASGAFKRRFRAQVRRLEGTEGTTFVLSGEAEGRAEGLALSPAEEDALALSLAQLPVGIAVVETSDDASGSQERVILSNSAYDSTFSVPPGGSTAVTRAVGPYGFRVVSPNEMPGHQAVATGALVNPFELQVTPSSGSRKVVVAVAAPVAGTNNRAVSVVLDVTDRAFAEEERAKSDRKYRGVFASSQDLLAVFVAVRTAAGVVDWNFLEANDALLNALGAQRGSIVGQRLGRVYPDMSWRVGEALARVIAEGTLFQQEVKLGDRDYVVRAFRVSSEEVAISALDITDMKRVERDLRASTERFERSVTTVPGVPFDYVMDAKGTGRFVYLSPGFKDMFGLEPAAVLESMALFNACIAPGECDTLSEQVRAPSGVAEVQVVTPSGVEKSVRATWRANGESPSGEITGSGFLFDVTDGRSARAELARSRRELFDLIVKLPIGVFVSRENVIVYANPEFASYLGRGDPAELVGVALRDMFAQDAGSTDEAGMVSERRAKHSDGHLVTLEVSASRDIELEGRRAVLWTARDVTEIRSIRAQLMQADRLASVGMLAAGVAHEINNPLAYLVASLDFLKECQESDVRNEADARDALVEALTGAKRIRQVVRDLQTFSRAEPERATSLSLAEVLDSAINMASVETRHRAQVVKRYTAIPRVRANEARLGQVFLNLLINAAQAIPVGRPAENEIRVSTFTDLEGRAVVEVRDTGEGISEDRLSRIFDPFFTTKAAGVGTGIGLALCRTTILGLGGRIDVESTVGVGTTFRVVLPPAVVSSMQQAVSSGPPKKPSRRGRVLVVDDEHAIVRSVERILGTEHEVASHTSASDALARLRRGERFDVILCDLMMPETTGMELHAALCELDADQAKRMIFLTGGAFTPQAAAFLDDERDRCVEKPFDAAVLRQIVRDAIVAGDRSPSRET